MINLGNITWFWPRVAGRMWATRYRYYLDTICWAVHILVLVVDEEHFCHFALIACTGLCMPCYYILDCMFWLIDAILYFLAWSYAYMDELLAVVFTDACYWCYLCIWICVPVALQWYLGIIHAWICYVIHPGWMDYWWTAYAVMLKCFALHDLMFPWILWK
jgi:hypothetical protein